MLSFRKNGDRQPAAALRPSERLAKLLETTHHEFVLGYGNARLIVTGPGGKNAAASPSAPGVEVTAYFPSSDR